MRMGTIGMLTLGALVMLLSVPAAGAFDFSELEGSVSEHTLDNGLKIIVMERHDAPVASFCTYVNVGGVDDPKEYTGLAHMFEHMAFKGTTTLGTTDLDAELELMRVEDSIFMELRAERKKGRLADSTRMAELEAAFETAIDEANQYVIPNAFDHILKKNGVVGLNAGTGMDQTIFMMSLPSNRMELWMAMESERFLNPVLREMYREREVIAEERRQTLENNPIQSLIDEVKSTAYKAHPYGISIVGHMSDIQNYNRAAARKQYEKYYVPSNMIVCVVGDVKPEEAIKLAKKYWGRLPVRPTPERLATVEPPQEGERRVVLEDPSQPLFIVAYHVPEGTHPDFPVLEALMDHLGQGRTSLLYKDLVKEKKIAAQTGGWAGYPANKYPCLALVYAIPSPDHTNEECEEAVLTQVQRMQDELISAEDLEKIKARAKAELINAMRSNMGMAIQLAGYQTDYGNWRRLFHQLETINGITAEDIQRVAKTYFTKQNRTVGKLNTIGS